MASSLLILLDDIATILDDVAVMSKMAAKKTAGVLGDDLALNAQQVSGVRTDRELPVVWAVAKGSFVNKLILVPAALLISVVAPWLITPLLMIGGLFLCYEGVEKVLHSLHHKKAKTEEEASQELTAIETDMATFEKDKVKGAIRTDFILSAEIVVISLGTVAAATFSTKVMVLSVIAILMTVGVYGFVAMIVKIDDLGLYLTQQASSFKQSIGRGLLAFAPKLMKTLTIVGTIAMFLVGGGIISHGVPLFHHFTEGSVDYAEHIPTVGSIIGALTPTLINLVIGFVAGLIVLAIVSLIKKVWPSSKKA
ncbi:Inner membrane protein YedI [compost metagenome]